MRKIWVPTITILRYRVKGTSEIVAVDATGFSINAIPVEWNDRGDPVRWHVEIIHENFVFTPCDVADWHEFATVEKSVWDETHAVPVI